VNALMSRICWPRVARDDERNVVRAGADILLFWLGRLGGGHGAVPSARCRVKSRHAAGRRDLIAQAQKIPYGMVPYGRPVYKNGKRMLWHGVWRAARLGPIRAPV